MGVARLAAVLVVEQRAAGHGEIAAPAGEFLKAPAALRRPRRQADLGDDLVGLERGRQRALEEIGRLDHARAGLADDGDLRLAGHRDAGHFGGRIGMRDAAADGAAVADLVMRDMRDRRHQQRMRRARAARRRGCRASAPWRRARTPSCADLDLVAAPASLRRSTSSDGAATRNAIIGTRLWPPASAFASPSCAASSATASESVVGQAYSKGGSFMTRHVPSNRWNRARFQAFSSIAARIAGQRAAAIMTHAGCIAGLVHDATCTFCYAGAPMN